MKKINYVLTLCALLINHACTAKQPAQLPGYEIIFEIKEIEEPVLYLGFYYKGRTYVGDTAYRKGKTRFVFHKKDKKLDHGFYFLLNDTKNLLFEFLVGKYQHFAFTLTKTNEAEKASVEGDINNKLFLQTIRANAASYVDAKPNLAILSDSTKSKELQKKAATELQKINKELHDMRYTIAEENPNLVISKFIRIDKNIDTPVANKPDGTTDTTFHFYYYRTHFFDYMPLDDPFYMRLPPASKEPVVDRISKKIDTYLDKLHLQQADTLIQGIERLANMTKEKEDIFTHIIWLCTVKYQEPKIMGLDKILVYLNDTYYATGRMDSWANEKLKEEIKKVADKRRLSLIGNIAPNLIMQDENLQRRSLYAMKHKYRIIYFFNPDCHGCALETPKLNKTYKESAFDIGIFAICADTSMVKMQKYIKKMDLQDWTVVSGPRSYVGNYQNLYDAFSTPIVMIIDQENRIVAKKIPSENIDNFLKGHEYLNEHYRKSAP